MVTTTATCDQLIAGVLAGGTSVALLHPLDLLKTRFQATTSAVHVRPFEVYRELLKIKQTSGVRALYRGFTANLLGSTVSWGTYFALYRLVKDSIPRNSPILGTSDYFLSATIAGVLTVLVSNPLWMAKSRLCQPAPAVNTLTGKPIAGTFECIKDAYVSNGISGLYRGLAAGLLGTVHGAVQFTAYEQMKQTLRRYKFQKAAAHLHQEFDSSFKQSQHVFPHETLVLSSSSKVVASIATYPIQVVRCRMQISPPLYHSIHHAIRDILKNEGLLGFYKGLAPNIMRVLPGACVTFMVYEQVVSAL